MIFAPTDSWSPLALQNAVTIGGKKYVFHLEVNMSLWLNICLYLNLSLWIFHVCFNTEGVTEMERFVWCWFFLTIRPVTKILGLTFSLINYCHIVDIITFFFILYVMQGILLFLFANGKAEAERGLVSCRWAGFGTASWYESHTCDQMFAHSG